MKKHFLRVCDYLILVVAVITYIGVSFLFQLCFDISPVLSSSIANVVIALTCGGLYIHFRKADIFQETKSEAKNPVVKYILFFIFISFCLLLVFSWINIYFSDPAMTQRTNSIQKSDMALYIATSILISPIAEETMMRLFLYNFLKTRSGWVASMIVTSIVFALLHGTISHLIVGTIFAVFLVLAYENTGRWYIPIIGHIIYNIMAVFLSSAVVFLGQFTPLMIMSALILLVLLLQQMTGVLQKQMKKS